MQQMGTWTEPVVRVETATAKDISPRLWMGCPVVTECISSEEDLPE